MGRVKLTLETISLPVYVANLQIVLYGCENVTKVSSERRKKGMSDQEKSLNEAKNSH